MFAQFPIPKKSVLLWATLSWYTRAHLSVYLRQNESKREAWGPPGVSKHTKPPNTQDGDEAPASLDIIQPSLSQDTQVRQTPRAAPSVHT